MKQVMLYCRAGFEKECAGEIQDRATELEVYGFPRLKKNTGFVLFECYQDGDAESSFLTALLFSYHFSFL